ncbi:MAG: hypothetical protein E6J23_07970 [Chloroflexi bacterium]|nr:MAG: hypothetical protein E6J23_07970 [Chloroflexota bacterium]HKC91059.1 hypothetical protein [Candidatus Limnocylindria bacterium]
MTDERGQAVLVAVLALAIAATAIIGIRAAQDRIVIAARAQRAGEAAVEAAAQAVADRYGAHAVAPRDLVNDPRVVEAARVAAVELARENGASGVEQVQLMCAKNRIEARLVLNGYSHHAGFSAPECSPY